jgi:flavin reductase (DIM6/NTAB) family NADH-FMN oxidoreductase RutF
MMNILIKPEEITDNVFKLIGSDWMLITAGTLQSFNMMTASWGGFGVLWHKPVCWCVLRPQRHTLKFLEKSAYFTLSFFDEKHRKALDYCGAKSGKDVNKMKESGLKPVETALKNISYEEARLTIECRKLYYQDIDPTHFIDPAIDANYPKKDYHRMFIGEVVTVRSH